MQINIDIPKEKTATLTGHRPKSLPWHYNDKTDGCLSFKIAVKQLFENAIQCCISYFLIGMAEGFDMISAELLFELKKDYDYIKIIAIIPCLNQESKWSPIQQKRYCRILEQCDIKIVLSNHYTPSCMNYRNKFMVEHSSICIACWNGKPSGTGNTVRFAQENVNKIVIINPEHYR